MGETRAKTKGLVERLRDGEFVIVAEGYLFEFERRGYLAAGHFVPEVVIEHPQLVKQLHHEYVHAGSDVVLAFTYYAHREKLRFIGKEHELETINRAALRIAREVADETGTLMAGNICNTTIYKLPPDEEIRTETKKMFMEQVAWAVEEGADFIVMETTSYLDEAMIALNVIKSFGLPAVITFSSHLRDGTLDGATYVEAFQKLREAGAAVVGLNCSRGPETMMPVLVEARKNYEGPLAALPVPYRTDNQHYTMQQLRDKNGKRSFPEFEAHMCSRSDIADFAQQCKENNVQYVGLCCGNMACYMRKLAETLGRRPPASKYSPDLSQHYAFSDTKTNPKTREYQTEVVARQFGWKD